MIMWNIYRNFMIWVILERDIPDTVYNTVTPTKKSRRGMVEVSVVDNS